jgi:hypothetical protein
MQFTGQLAAFPASNLLQWADQERATGVLVVRRSTVEKRIGLRSGRVYECRSNQPRELFGRFLVDHERVGVDELSRALALGRERGLPLGRALVESRLLPEEAIAGLLRRWMSESVQDLFLWTRGVFYFDDRPPVGGPPSVAGSHGLEVDLDPRELALEGTRWVDEQARIRKRLPDDGVVVKIGPAWPGEMLAPYDARIARGGNPEAALGALRAVVGGVDFPFLEAVSRLIAAKVLAIDRHQPSDPRSSRELKIADLLYEIEAQEGGARVRGERALVPMDVFEALVPAWIQAPPVGDLEALPGLQRAFLEAIDGRSSLRRLLAPEEDVQSDQIDLLLLHLRRRNLLLLPAPVDEVERRLAGDSPLRGLFRRLRG